MNTQTFSRRTVNKNNAFVSAAFIICFVLVFSAVIPPAAAAFHVTSSHGHYRTDTRCGTCVKIASMFSLSGSLSCPAVSAFALFLSLLPEYTVFSGTDNSAENTFLSSKVRLNL